MTPRGFSAAHGVATLHDPALFTSWFRRLDCCDAVMTARDPVVAANKRLMMEFEVALAETVRTFEPFISTLFRIAGGQLAEHRSASRRGADFPAHDEIHHDT